MDIGSDDRVIFEFPVMHRGWEMDSIGWVYETSGGERYLVLTSQGIRYRVKGDEFLRKMGEYREVIGQSELALSMLSPPRSS